MRNIGSKLFDGLQRLLYPELFVLFTMSLLWFSFDLPSIFRVLASFLLVATGAVFVLTILYPRAVTTNMAVVGLLAIASGILQLNYVPSLIIWMLIFARLILSPTRQFALLSSVTFVMLVISLVIAKFFLPDFVLSETHQTLLDLVSLSLSMVAVLLYLGRLNYLLGKTGETITQYQQRIDTLVRVTNRLARFLPPQVWQPIIQNQPAVEVISQRRKLTILFSDIVGFTDLSDTISADHLANLLNTYFDRMTQITLKYGATLDKFIGDGMLCYFGDTPNSKEREDAIRCAKMAIDMRREMDVLRKEWRLLGFEGLDVRIGINTGYCYVGNFGSYNRMTYTVIGKEANFAARLESAAQKGQILISETTYLLISHEHHCDFIGEMKLKGLQEPVKVWQLCDPHQHQAKDSDWVNYQLPGFNLHLNFHDIRNYDRRTILSHLNQALDLMEKKSDKIDKT